MSGARVHLSRECEAEIRAGAVAAYPNEACGILVGVAGAGRVEVRRVIAAVNRSDMPGKHYVIDPRDILEADRAARGAGMDVVGVWHSHPDAAAVPSARDRAEAWEGTVYAIISIHRGACGVVRMWGLAEAGGEFAEILRET